MFGAQGAQMEWFWTDSHCLPVEMAFVGQRPLEGELGEIDLG